MSIIDKIKLEPYLEEKLGVNDLSITSVWQNLEGWSMETFSIGLSYSKNNGKEEREIIIRKQPEAGLMEDNYDVSIEYRVLTGLNKTDVAVPETYWYEEDPEIMGLPFYVMEKVEGNIPFPPIASFNPNYRMIKDDNERLSIGNDFIKNLAAIHTADWKTLELDFLGVPEKGTGSALMEVEFWEERIAKAGFRKKPAVAYVINWLKSNLVENDRICIVHGDYRSGNYITRDGHIVAILDWELVHLGDPLHDIAYSLSAWRGAPPDKWLSHLLPKEEFFARYEEASGIKIDEEKLTFYMMMHHLKSVGISSTAAGTFRSKEKLNLKIGAFSMMQYLVYPALSNELRKQSPSITKGV